MSTIASPSPSPPPTPNLQRTKSCARTCERTCCTIATYFPLAFVYSLTTWAIYVEASLGLRAPSLGQTRPWTAKPSSIFGILLYLLLTTSYTVAVFNDPGSPLQVHPTNRSTKYSSLPTTEPSHDPNLLHTITVSSSGSPRYCKKCQTPKPDRTHHCSTCKRCVLKMDHHCPWLATCLGLHNYKAFVLFLIYTCLFCWVCFFSTATWVWQNIFEDSQYLEELMPVAVIMLAVISGIIGLVLSGFTAWHFYLCITGQTTIECLERTRYFGAMRQQVERQRQEHHRRASPPHGFNEHLQRAGEQLLELHANAVPGATRLEEGEEHTSPAPSTRRPSGYGQADDTPAQQVLRRTYSSMEMQRERDRYEDYIDDQESGKLPNAFDLGWRRNLLHLFGPKPLFWALPVCNSTGDGWKWEISRRWALATEELARKRQASRDYRDDLYNSSGLRGGEGYVDSEVGENGHTYGGSPGRPSSLGGMSMQTLKQSPGFTKASQRRDFDQANEGGERDHFEVSSSEGEPEVERQGRSGGRRRHWD